MQREDPTRCSKRQQELKRRGYSPRCLLDTGHAGRHNYQNPGNDDKRLRRFLDNRSERGMM